MKKLVCFIVFITLVSLCGCSTKNGFIKVGSNTYYYDNGVMQRGWKNINGDWYYFSGQGSMIQGSILKEGDDWYYLDSYDGKMAKNRWILDDGEEYYAGSDGKIVRNKTININGQEYSFDADGKVKKLIFQIPYIGKNIYLKDSLPKKYKSYSDYYNALLYDNLEFDFSTHYYGVYLNIYGIVERLSGQGSLGLTCRLSAVDQSGITVSDTDFSHSNSLNAGEKGRIAWEIELGQFNGCSDLYLEFK